MSLSAEAVIGRIRILLLHSVSKAEHTSQEPVLSDAFDGPYSLLVLFQVKQRLEIPPNDCGSVSRKIQLGIRWLTQTSHSLVPATGNEQPRIVRVERADVVPVADQCVRRLRGLVTRGRPQTDSRRLGPNGDVC